MRRIPVALISIAGLIVLGACAGRDSTEPRGLAADAANYSNAAGGTSSCNFTTMKSLARSYFTSNQDSVYGYMSAMSKVYDGGKTDTATKVGWTIGRLVAKERLTSATTTGAAGGAFLIGVMQCMADVSASKVAGAYPALAIPDSFSVHSASIVTSGVWEVRGGTTNSQLPAAGRVIDHTSLKRNFGLPRWGVEPTGNTWPGATQYAVYGYPKNVGQLVIGSAGNIDTNEVATNSFELGTIPNGTSKANLRVGVCIQQDTGGVANRILHSNSEILDISNLTQLCNYANTNFTASLQLPPTWYATTLSTIGKLLSPAPAFAQFTDDCTDCIGGLPSGWSPFTPGGFTVSNVVLSIVTQPNDAIEVVPPDTIPDVFVTIKATINGVAVPGVSVDTIAVFNNSGSPAGAVVTAFNRGSPTGSNGQTTASFGIGKPGGYIVVISAKLDGSSTQVVTSAMFHIKNS